MLFDKILKTFPSWLIFYDGGSGDGGGGCINKEVLLLLLLLLLLKYAVYLQVYGII